MTQGIYSITNTINGRAYVGSSGRVEKRWADHRKLLGRGEHHSGALQNAWSKYGPEAFTFLIIEEVPAAPDLVAREQFWIDQIRAYPDGYNGRARAESSRGHHLSAETRAKMAAAHSGKKKSPEHIANCAAANTGKKRSAESRERMSRARLAYFAANSVSEETKEKLRVANTGKKMSPDAIARTAAAMRGRKASDETRAKQRAAKLGKKLNPEHVARRSESNRGKKRTPEHVANIMAGRLRAAHERAL